MTTITNEKINYDAELEIRAAATATSKNVETITITRKKAVQKGIHHGNRIDMIIRAIRYAQEKIDMLRNENIDNLITKFEELNVRYKESLKGKEPEHLLRGKIAKMSDEEFDNKTAELLAKIERMKQMRSELKAKAEA